MLTQNNVERRENVGTQQVFHQTGGRERDGTGKQAGGTTKRDGNPDFVEQPRNNLAEGGTGGKWFHLLRDIGETQSYDQP